MKEQGAFQMHVQPELVDDAIPKHAALNLTITLPEATSIAYG